MPAEQKDGGVVYMRWGKVAAHMFQAPHFYAGSASGTWYQDCIHVLCICP